MDRTPVALAGLPAALQWTGTPDSSATVTSAGLQMTVSATTDLFCDPRGQPPVLNAPRLLFRPDRHFTLSAHVTVAFQATYDAGVLLIYQHETAWAKLCCEYSPQHQPMIVSVVTNGRSDDANAVVLDQGRAFLRVTGLGDAFAFHYSLDGSTWQLVRYFALPQPDHVQVGFSVQAPTGSGCQADFAHIHYVAASVSDIRSGV